MGLSSAVGRILCVTGAHGANSPCGACGCCSIVRCVLTVAPRLLDQSSGSSPHLPTAVADCLPTVEEGQPKFKEELLIQGRPEDRKVHLGGLNRRGSNEQGPEHNARRACEHSAGE